MIVLFMDDDHSHLRSLNKEYREQLKITKEIEEYYHIGSKPVQQDAFLDEITMDIKCRFALERQGLKTNGDISKYVNELTDLNERLVSGDVSKKEYIKAYKKLREDFYISHRNGKRDKNLFLKEIEKMY